MKKNIGLLIVLVLIGFALYSFVNKETEAQKKVAQPGKEEQVSKQLAPDFTVQTLGGQTLTLSDLQGKKVVLNVWATWCPPCRTEMPHMQSYYEQYHEQDNVEIVALNVTYTEENLEHVQSFATSHRLTFPIALAESEEVVNSYGVVTLPSTFFINTAGEIQHEIVGPVDEEMLRDYVQKLN